MGFLDPKPVTPNWIVAQINAAGTAVRNALDAIFPQKANLRLNVKDYGALGDGIANDTAAINDTIAAAATFGAAVWFPPGTYKADNINVPAYVILIGDCQSFARFGPSNPHGGKAVTRILRSNAASTNPLVTLAGAGSGLQDIQLEGLGAPGTLLVQQGFETTCWNVRVISGTGIGIDIQKANNMRWGQIYVDNVGSATLPGVKIWSKAGVGGANETNAYFINGLRIERCANSALDIAYNPTDPSNGEYWAEWGILWALHIESNDQNIGVGAGVGNTAALVRIGNIRSLDIFGPFIYGGPGYLLEHNQVFTRAYGNGGIKIHGGQLLGSDTNIPGMAATPSLVNLVKGDGFVLSGGTKLDRYTSHAVVSAAGYGGNVYFDPMTLWATANYHNDLRPNGTRYGQKHMQDAEFHKHIQSAGSAPSLANGSGVTGSTFLSGSTDTAGKTFWGTTASPVAGIMQQVTFAKPYTREPTIVLTPGNAATAALGLYVASSSTLFTIRATNAPAASQANTTYQVNYAVIG